MIKGTKKSVESYHDPVVSTVTRLSLELSDGHLLWLGQGEVEGRRRVALHEKGEKQC